MYRNGADLTQNFLNQTLYIIFFRLSGTGLTRPKSGMVSLRSPTGYTESSPRPQSGRYGLPTSHSAPVLHTDHHAPPLHSSKYIRYLCGNLRAHCCVLKSSLTMLESSLSYILHCRRHIVSII